MIPGVLETFLDRRPPAWMRKIEAAVLLGVFADAFDVDPPATEDLSADATLYAFREFSAACMEAALADQELAERYRLQLGLKAYELGAKARHVLGVRPNQALPLLRFLYRGIGIELSGELPSELSFVPCSFSKRYTPDDCWFMSAFDEGIMRGISGLPTANLVFSCRLSEGAPCCKARFE